MNSRSATKEDLNLSFVGVMPDDLDAYDCMTKALDTLLPDAIVLDVNGAVAKAVTDYASENRLPLLTKLDLPNGVLDQVWDIREAIRRLGDKGNVVHVGGLANLLDDELLEDSCPATLWQYFQFEHLSGNIPEPKRYSLRSF